ncbi:MAG: hypothetical protein IKE73_01795 [Bacilli bacterium]|nr:hypothetical protein [Bacilli bacterium]
MKKYIVIILLCFFITGCKFYDEYEMPEEVSININDKKFEVYTDHKLEEIIDENNVEILNSDESLKSSKVGKNKVTIKYKYKDREYKYDVNYEVVDTEKPTLLDMPDYFSVNAGEEINIDKMCEETEYIDNYDREPSCNVTGEYDINTPGTYNIKYEIKDSSDNISNSDLVLYVNSIDGSDDEDYYDDGDYDYYEDDDYEEDDEDYYPGYIDFNDVLANHKTDKTMIGLDISKWQGDVDFKAIKKAGAEFVILRMAVSMGVDDKIGLDGYYEQNIRNAKKAGLKVGVYVYTAASSEKEITSQAKYIKKHLNKVKLDFPVAYDFENWWEIKDLKVSKHDLIHYVDIFSDILAEDGYDVMIYGSKYYLEKVWGETKYPTWLAHYVDETGYEGDYILWQMCSDGRIDGIYGDVDIDIYYKKD